MWLHTICNRSVNGIEPSSLHFAGVVSCEAAQMLGIQNDDKTLKLAEIWWDNRIQFQHKHIMRECSACLLCLVCLLCTPVDSKCMRDLHSLPCGGTGANRHDETTPGMCAIATCSSVRGMVQPC